jgi:transcriptional regulator with XRE-family HTH domain
VIETQRDLLANIKNQMFRHQMTVPDLAAACGLTPSGMYSLLEGVAVPKLIYLEKMARRFKCSVADLFGARGAVAKDAPTLSEALRVIEREAERIAKQPDLSHVPNDLLALLATSGAAEFEAIRRTLLAMASGKERAKVLRKKRSKLSDAVS